MIIDIEYTNKCPECGDDNLKRIRRKWWMKCLKMSRLYFCHDCSKKYLIWRNRVFMTFRVVIKEDEE